MPPGDASTPVEPGDAGLPVDPGDGGNAICHATDAVSLLACAAQANQGAFDEISIDAAIQCSGTNACAVLIYERTRPLAIHGGNAYAGLTRSDGDYTFVTIQSSSQITLADLIITDAANVTDYAHPTDTLTATNAACQPARGSLCAPALTVSDSSFVTLRNVTVTHAKNTAVTVGSSQDVTFSNCTFRDAFLLGVQLVDAANQRITLRENLFEDIRSNALVLVGSTLTVENNTFHHDHHAAGWWASPSSHVPSSGGNVFIYNHVHDLIFDGNEIYGGSIDESIDPEVSLDEYGLQSQGIELDYAGDLGQTTDLSNLRITNNRIHHMRGVALGLPLDYVYDTSVGLVFTGNTMYADFTDPTTGAPISAHIRSATYAGPRTCQFPDNCYAASCPAAQPPTPTPPPGPTVTAHGIGCADGYGIYVTGVFTSAAYAIVLDASTQAVLNNYIGSGGPYAVNGRTHTDNNDGTRSLSFCLLTAAEKTALDSTGLRVFVTDPFTYLQKDVTISRASP